MDFFVGNIFKYGVFSSKIRLEASSVCQLKCPECPQASGDMGIIGRGNLKYEDFTGFVDTCPGIKNIEISNWGEIFLNPELGDIIRYAYEKGIKLTAENGVNLNTADDNILEDLVKYGFRALYVSLDGATAATYEMYRRGGDFDKVIGNIRKINFLKKKYDSNYPVLTWQFIVFGHNEHEIPAARSMADGLNMKFKPKLNAHPDFSPVIDKDLVKKEIGMVSRDEYASELNKLYMFPCYQFWFSPMINWDGRLLGCCMNIWKDFGNVFKSGLKKCVGSEEYRYTRKMLLGREKLRDDTPCFYCPIYKEVEKLTSNALCPEFRFMVQILSKRFRSF